MRGHPLRGSAIETQRQPGAALVQSHAKVTILGQEGGEIPSPSCDEIGPASLENLPHSGLRRPPACPPTSEQSFRRKEIQENLLDLIWAGLISGSFPLCGDCL